MTTINLDQIRKALPDRATVTLRKRNGYCFLECKVASPSLSELDFETCQNWQRFIIGKENISEFYTEETGRHWFVFLKRLPFEFQNCNDEDVATYTDIPDAVKRFTQKA